MQFELGCPSSTSNTTCLKLQSSSSLSSVFCISVINITQVTCILNQGTLITSPFLAYHTSNWSPNPLHFFCSLCHYTVPFSPFLLLLIAKNDVIFKAFEWFPSTLRREANFLYTEAKLFTVTSLLMNRCNAYFFLLLLGFWVPKHHWEFVYSELTKTFIFPPAHTFMCTIFWFKH